MAITRKTQQVVKMTTLGNKMSGSHGPPTKEFRGVNS